MALKELFLPLQANDYLVPGERVWYHRRRHLAVLLEPTFEFLAATVLFGWMMIDVPALTQSLGAMIMVLLAVGVVGRVLFRVDWKAPRTIATIFAFGVLVWAVQADVPAAGLLVVLRMAAKVVVRWVRWRWFRRLLITDRRIIEVDGLISSSVASMPIGRVTDAVLHRSPLAEILGYGEFRVESAGQEQALARINFVEDPDLFHRLIVQMATHEHPVEPTSPDGSNAPRIFDQFAV